MIKARKYVKTSDTPCTYRHTFKALFDKWNHTKAGGFDYIKTSDIIQKGYKILSISSTWFMINS